MIVLPLYKEVWQGKKDIWFRFYLLSGKAFQSFMVGRKQTLYCIHSAALDLEKQSAVSCPLSRGSGDQLGAVNDGLVLQFCTGWRVSQLFCGVVERAPQDY